MFNLYATINDTLVFAPSPKGWDENDGVKGNWKTVEGPRVAENILAKDAEEFERKSRAIRELWPTAVIRFAQM